MALRWLVFTLILLGAPALAEVARVTGGEHEDFTRLVVDGGPAGDWALGRAPDGYELKMPPQVTSFDVTDAFARIPRDRLAALWQDPDTGLLRFSLGCACHAIAFEYRPGIVVIDIRNGPPPEGSAFEQPLAGTGTAEAEDPAAVPAPAPASAAYDWVALQRQEGAKDANLSLPLDLPTGDVSLDPLRDALLSEISKGAAEGVVEIVEGNPRPDDAAASLDDDLWSRLSVGELPGLSAGGPDAGETSLTKDGRTCPADTALAVTDWGGAGPVASQIGLARSGTLAEFDVPDVDAVLRAARFHVFLGFGAEARQILGLLPDLTTDEARFLQAMARIVDEEPEPAGVFAGMESCDSHAALWAVLSRDLASPLPAATNSAAIVRAFSALPIHLRRHIGGRLVDLYLANGDQETARKLRDAALRVPAEGDPDAALMDARYQLADGNEDKAHDLAEGVLAERGPDAARAAMTIVEAAFRGDRQIAADLPSALEAFLDAAQGGADEAGLIRAVALAHTMTGSFATALQDPRIDEATFADIWSIAAEAEGEDVFLDLAARFANGRPRLPAETEQKVAQRLMDAGMADLAIAWLGEPEADDSVERRLMLAEAHLAVRDPSGAVAALSGLSGPEADRIRGLVAQQTGDFRLAAESLARAGATDEGARTAVWSQDWSFALEAGPEAWKPALGQVLSPPQATDAGDGAVGPMAQGATLLEDSAATRAAITDLLTLVEPPAATQ